MKTPDPNRLATAIERLLHIRDIRALLPLTVFSIPLGLYYFAYSTPPTSLVDWFTTGAAGAILLIVYCFFKKWG